MTLPFSLVRFALILFLVPVLVNAQQPQQTPEQILKRGEELYGSTCATCHGENGVGGSGPRLAGRKLDGDYVTQVVTFGRPGTAMPAWGQKLTAVEVRAVIMYVNNLNGIAISPNSAPVALPPEAAAGRDLFFDITMELKACSNCHAINGRGVPVTPPISKVPADVSGLHNLATPQVSTATVNGEVFPSLAVTQVRDRTKLYDLTVVPPVLRTFPSSSVKLKDGSEWRHASVLGTYSEKELNSILAFLRASLRP